MLVRQVAHVGLVNIMPDKPAHRSAGDHVRGKVLTRGNPRGTHDPGKAVCGYLDKRVVPILMSHQRGNGPHLDGVSRRKRSATAPKVAWMFLVRAALLPSGSQRQSSRPAMTLCQVRRSRVPSHYPATFRIRRSQPQQGSACTTRRCWEILPPHRIMFMAVLE